MNVNERILFVIAGNKVIADKKSEFGEYDYNLYLISQN